jgi:hypothetical protein
VPGDFVLAKKWYGTRAKYIHNLMYMSHVARDNDNIQSGNSHSSQLKIQVGNSADPSNNHIEILQKLARLNKQNFVIYCPLSYGEKDYADKILKYGKKYFGDRFQPIMKFMDFEKYNQYLSSINIAIFNHDRQQAMGNIIGLLSLGKTVLIKSTTTSYQYLIDLDLHIGKTENISDLSLLNDDERADNISRSHSYFTEDRLVEDWENIFEQ